MVADVALPGVGGEEQPPSHPVGQHWQLLLRALFVFIGTEVEQHALLFHSNQAFVEPGPLSRSLSPLPPLHQVLAPDGHLEAAVDDLAG